MDLDDKKYLLGIIINNLANASSACITASTKLVEYGLESDGSTINELARIATQLDDLRAMYKATLGELPADDRQS